MGSAGFLCEAYDYLKSLAKSTVDSKTLQRRTFYGKEKKSLACLIAIMHMILHGIEASNILRTNTLGENLNDIQETDRHDAILADPPFCGKGRPKIQQNFPIKTGETAFLFLQHFIKSLRADGTAAIVIKNTFLSNGDNASMKLRKGLLESCNLHTVLDRLADRLQDRDDQAGMEHAGFPSLSRSGSSSANGSLPADSVAPKPSGTSRYRVRKAETSHETGDRLTPAQQASSRCPAPDGSPVDIALLDEKLPADRD